VRIHILTVNDLASQDLVDTSAMKMEESLSSEMVCLYTAAHGATSQITAYVGYIDSLPSNHFDKTMQLNAIPGRLNSIHILMSYFSNINFNITHPRKSMCLSFFLTVRFSFNICSVGLFFISPCTLHALPI